MTRYATMSAFSASIFAVFALNFDPSTFSPIIDASFFASVALAIIALKSGRWTNATHEPRLFALCAAYAVVALAIANDWRWTLAGDSMGWPMAGLGVAKNGLQDSILSVHGVAQFGALQTHIHNAFMYIVDPTIFWHRAGKVVIGIWMIASCYAWFSLLVPRNFALAAAACVAATPTAFAHTLCSYPIIDAVPASMTVLYCAIRVKSSPDERNLWLKYAIACGVCSFLSANSWFMVAFTALMLAPSSNRRHTPAALALAAMIAYPTAIQLLSGEGSNFYSLVTGGTLSLERISHLALQAATISFHWSEYSALMFGPQLPPGIRYLFPIGLALALKYPNTRIVVAAWAAHVVLLSITQGPYDNLSPKRALVLVPFSVLFSIIPIAKLLNRKPAPLAFAALYVALSANSLINQVKPGVLGYTVIDGIVEVSRRFADQSPCVVTQIEQSSIDTINQVYSISPPIRFVTNKNTNDCPILCSTSMPPGTPIELHNSSELRCSYQ